MAFAMIIVIVGFLLLLDKLGIISDSVWELFWPLAIIVIGLSLMYRKMYGQSWWDPGLSSGKDPQSSSRPRSQKRTSRAKS